MATDLLPYADPTGDTAVANVDRSMRGADHTAFTHAADEYLEPAEYALAAIAKTAYARDEDGTRTGILPWLDPAWTRRRRAKAMSNETVAELLVRLSPTLHRIRTENEA